MNVLPMIFRLRSGSVTPLRLPRKIFVAFFVLQLDLEMAAENFLHDVRFVGAQQTVVHENTGELIANGFVEQAPPQRWNPRRR